MGFVAGLLMLLAYISLLTAGVFTLIEFYKLGFMIGFFLSLFAELYFLAKLIAGFDDMKKKWWLWL